MTDPKEVLENYKYKHEKELEAQLLPCPFCGGKGKFVDTNYVLVRCDKCGTTTAFCLNREFASRFWNNRVQDSRIAQLHSEIYHLKNRITELDDELRIKQSIINKQVAMMGEMEHEAEQ